MSAPVIRYTPSPSQVAKWLRELYPHGAPSRSLRYVCAAVIFRARIHRIANRTPHDQ